MRSFWQLLERSTLRDIVLVCLADGIVGVSFGAIATSNGLPIAVPITLSLFVFAGGSQFAFIGVLIAGGGSLAAVATGLLLNSRLIAYGFTVRSSLGHALWQKLLTAHLITDESVAFAIQQTEPKKRTAAFLICGFTLFLCWNIPVAIGALLGRSIGDAAKLGLDAAFPTILLALVIPALQSSLVQKRAALGAVIAVSTTPFLIPGLPVFLSLLGLLIREPRGPRAKHIKEEKP